MSGKVTVHRGQHPLPQSALSLFAKKFDQYIKISYWKWLRAVARPPRTESVQIPPSPRSWGGHVSPVFLRVRWLILLFAHLTIAHGSKWYLYGFVRQMWKVECGLRMHEIDWGAISNTSGLLPQFGFNFFKKNPPTHTCTIFVTFWATFSNRRLFSNTSLQGLNYEHNFQTAVKQWFPPKIYLLQQSAHTSVSNYFILRNVLAKL